MRVSLTQGAYSSRSVIAEAQRSVNLYAEKNPDDALAPFTHYSVPGLTPLVAPSPAPARGLYWSNIGKLFYVAGASVYLVAQGWTLTQIGSIAYGTTPVSMADNGTSLLLVDGTSAGYEIDLTSLAFTAINPTDNGPASESMAVFAFYGADRVDVLDGFILLNQPGTRNFYSTYNNEITFDALYFAAKNGFSDNLVALIVTAREAWLIGERTTEIWFDAGATDFPFQLMPGPFIQHGCVAKYSIAQVDSAIFWLSQDQSGQNIVARGHGYAAARISTHALEAEFASYEVVSDAVGFCYQQGGHSFYMLTFPSADKTWCWDEMTQLWHERVWVDTNGAEHRHRAQCAAFAYGQNVVADWQTGQLYALDLANNTDAGAPMQFRRGWPHLMNDGKRVLYARFALDMECATSPSTSRGSGPFPIDVSPPQMPEFLTPDGSDDALLAVSEQSADPPMVNLRWSDTRGRTWGAPVPQSVGATGDFLVQPQWRRLGMARDRVFEVYGVIPGRLAINGAFIDMAASAS